MSPATTIVESEFVSAQLDRLREQYPRFDSYWERGLSWILARNPKVGIRVPDIDPPRYVWGVNQWNAGGIPRMVIVYRYDEGIGPIDLERVTAHEFKERRAKP